MTSETETRLSPEGIGHGANGPAMDAFGTAADSDDGAGDFVNANRRLKLLLVDDDDADRLILRRSLARSGELLDIDEAATVAEALRRLQHARYDCVFVDDRLPGDGAGAIRNANDAAALILLTAGDDDAVASDPARDYLSKDELNGSAIRRVLLAALEKRKLRDNLEERQAELSSSRRELVEFAEMTSRDLQEPLGIIVSFMQRLERRSGDNLDARSRDYMKQIVDGSMRMQQLVGSLLELSRIGRSGETFERCAIAELLQEALSNLQVAIVDCSATLHCDRLPTIACNRQRIVQLLTLLVDNALRYRGTSRPELRIGARPVALDSAERLRFKAPLRHQTIWQFCLEDNGAGVDPTDAERIFDLFQRRRAEGNTDVDSDDNGVGLALCRRIVELHGGRIWVERSDDGGSRFCFTLPGEQP